MAFLQCEIRVSVNDGVPKHQHTRQVMRYLQYGESPDLLNATEFQGRARGEYTALIDNLKPAKLQTKSRADKHTKSGLICFGRVFQKEE